jgi:hypothetical protein
LPIGNCSYIPFLKRFKVAYQERDRGKQGMKKVLLAIVLMGFIIGTAHADWILYITTFPIPSCPSIACGHVTPTESYSSRESCKKVADQLVDQFRAGTNDRKDLIYAVQEGIITAYHKDKMQARLGYTCLPNEELRQK